MHGATQCCSLRYLHNTIIDGKQVGIGMQATVTVKPKCLTYGMHLCSCHQITPVVIGAPSVQAHKGQLQARHPCASRSHQNMLGHVGFLCLIADPDATG